jgi:hypothetical protein
MPKKFFIDEEDLVLGAENNSIVLVDPITNDRIIGTLQEKLQFSIDANWDNIFNVSDRFNALRIGASLYDPGLLNTGILTRKYFKGGSYLKISPKFRVVDWDGAGIVVRQAMELMNLALPVQSKILDVGKFKGFLEKNTIGSTLTGLGTIAKAGGKIVKGVVQQAASEISKYATADLDEQATKIESALDGISSINLADATGAKYGIDLLLKIGNGSNSAHLVNVKVSNYFQHNFVIENVSVEFSKEMTEAGPMYADFDLTMSTIEAAVRGGTGLKSGVRSNPRFSRL